MSHSATFESLLDQFASRGAVRAADSAQQPLLSTLVGNGFAHLPLPGQGQTLDRWRTLAAVAASDLALAKLYESHADALAIMLELQPRLSPATGIWGVWAAEPPFAQVDIVDRQGERVYLQGRKAWCSGASLLDWALMTTRDEQRRPQLVAVALNQSGVRMIGDNWQAVGMGSTLTMDVEFESARARCVGTPGQYLDRPGFWHGGGGIAACWYGAACALAGYLREHCSGPRHDAHAEAHLGAVDAALCSASAVLKETARWIDAHPQASAETAVRCLRAQVEASATLVLEHVGRALGAAPFCRNSHFARLAADLPVFMRQSHGEKDLAELGKLIVTQSAERWLL